MIYEVEYLQANGDFELNFYELGNEMACCYLQTILLLKAG